MANFRLDDPGVTLLDPVEGVALAVSSAATAKIIPLSPPYFLEQAEAECRCRIWAGILGGTDPYDVNDWPTGLTEYPAVIATRPGSATYPYSLVSQSGTVAADLGTVYHVRVVVSETGGVRTYQEGTAVPVPGSPGEYSLFAGAQCYAHFVLGHWGETESPGPTVRSEFENTPGVPDQVAGPAVGLGDVLDYGDGYLTVQRAGFYGISAYLTSADYYTELWGFTEGTEPYTVGTDMAVCPRGWLYRCRRDGGDVIVERSINAGRTWTSVTAATDAASDASPTLAIARSGEVFVWYHTSAGATGRISLDCGATWANWASAAGVKFPRARVGLERTYLVGHSDGALRVFASADWGQALAESYAIAGLEEQLAAMEIDRRGYLHLVYRDGAGALQHRYSTGGAVWSDAGEWAASGQFPTYVAGIRWGTLAYWDGGALVVKRTDSAQSAIAADLGAPSGVSEGYLGMAEDHQGVLWGAGLDGGGAAVQRYSITAGIDWS